MFWVATSGLDPLHLKEVHCLVVDLAETTGDRQRDHKCRSSRVIVEVEAGSGVQIDSDCRQVYSAALLLDWKV